MRETEMRKRGREISVGNDVALSRLEGQTFVKCRGEFVHGHGDHVLARLLLLSDRRVAE